MKVIETTEYSRFRDEEWKLTYSFEGYTQKVLCTDKLELKADNIAKAFGRLLGILHKKNLLDDREVLDVIEEYSDARIVEGEVI